MSTDKNHKDYDDADLGDSHPFPIEHPNRPREYHGIKTIITSVLVVGVVIAAIWIAFDHDPMNQTPGNLGLDPTPAYLTPSGLIENISANELAPDFELETLKGDRFRLSDWRGHPLVLSFWASWCNSCRQEMPILIQLQEQYREKGVLFFGINIEEAREPAKKFAEEFEINFPLPMDFSGEVTERYFTTNAGPPHSFFIRPDGTILKFFIGQAPAEEFEVAVQDLANLLIDPIGPHMRPGLKALPNKYIDVNRKIGVHPGEQAPDLVLSWRSNPEKLWRLSNYQGKSLLLAFTGSNCNDCRVLLRDVLQIANKRTIDTYIVSTPDFVNPLSNFENELLWNDQVGNFFTRNEVIQFFIIDESGIVFAAAKDKNEITAKITELTSGAVEETRHSS